MIWQQDFTKITNIQQYGWNIQHLPPYKYNNQFQAYDQTGIKYSNDGLIIRTYIDSHNNVKSGRVNTQNKIMFKYGYIEATIKFQQCVGIWPAFWMLGSVGGGWPNNGEIDIMEWVGRDPNAVFGTLHGPGYCAGDCFGSQNNNNQNIKAKSKNILEKPLSGEFHKYAINWQPNKIQWYIDKIMYFKATPESLKEYRPNVKWLFNDRSFFLILNQAIGGNFGGAGIKEGDIRNELKKYGHRDLVVRNISVSQTANGFGQLVGNNIQNNNNNHNNSHTDNNISTLRSFHNTYLRGYPDGKVDVTSNNDTWQKWQWIYIGQNRFFWKSIHHGTYLMANPNGSVSLSPNQKEWEIWTKIDHEGFSIWKSFHGTYLRAYPNGHVDLASEPKQWERWVG